MDPVSVGLIIVAIISAVSAYASQRAASKASVVNTTTSSRVEMEKDAYTRARAMDLETIARQGKELEDLREDCKNISLENESLHEEVQTLRKRVARLERSMDQKIEKLLQERLGEGSEH